MTDEETKICLEINKLLCNFFKHNYDKVNMWYITKNPLLGNVSPLYMIRIGKVNKLFEFVKNQIEGEWP